jgi:hypothetical protein
MTQRIICSHCFSAPSNKNGHHNQTLKFIWWSNWAISFVRNRFTGQLMMLLASTELCANDFNWDTLLAHREDIHLIWMQCSRACEHGSFEQNSTKCMMIVQTFLPIWNLAKHRGTTSNNEGKNSWCVGNALHWRRSSLVKYWSPGRVCGIRIFGLDSEH